MRNHRRAALVILVGLLAACGSLHAARKASSAARPSVADDFTVLATVRGAKCNDAQPSHLPPGWRETSTQCAWHDRLQMRRWQSGPDAVKAACTSAPARWWAWARKREAVTGPSPAWNVAWSTQTLIDASGAQQGVAIIERAPDGTWVATEWRWSPSPRAATRAWQQGRWNLLTSGLTARQRATRATTENQDVQQLRDTWQKTLGTAVAEIAPDGWRWERDGMCLRMETAGLGQARLHLPFAREDGRLEQRAAIQLRLARTFPKALWLTPFRLLPVARTADGSVIRGAKYEAVWREDGVIKAQLWMPTRMTGAIVRARLLAPLPNPTVHDDDPSVRRIAELLERELMTLASQWETDHEP